MSKLTHLTIKLPDTLIEQIQKAIASGYASDINQFVTSAIEHQLSDFEPDNDPIWQLGSNPVECDVVDASTNLDQYLYNASE